MKLTKFVSLLILRKVKDMQHSGVDRGEILWCQNTYKHYRTVHKVSALL